MEVSDSDVQSSLQQGDPSPLLPLPRSSPSSLSSHCPHAPLNSFLAPFPSPPLLLCTLPDPPPHRSSSHPPPPHRSFLPLPTAPSSHPPPPQRSFLAPSPFPPLLPHTLPLPSYRLKVMVWYVSSKMGRYYEYYFPGHYTLISDNHHPISVREFIWGLPPIKKSLLPPPRDGKHQK